MAADNGVAWGEFGGLLLPRTRREAWSDERLPAWVIKALHLPPQATFASLDWGVRLISGKVPERVTRALATLVTPR